MNAQDYAIYKGTPVPQANPRMILANKLRIFSESGLRGLNLSRSEAATIVNQQNKKFLVDAKSSRTFVGYGLSSSALLTWLNLPTIGKVFHTTNTNGGMILFSSCLLVVLVIQLIGVYLASKSLPRAYCLYATELEIKASAKYGASR
jgi:hypothetical protein